MPTRWAYEVLQEIREVKGQDEHNTDNWDELLDLCLDNPVDIPGHDFFVKVCDQAAIALICYRDKLSPCAVVLLEKLVEGLAEAGFSQPNKKKKTQKIIRWNVGPIALESTSGSSRVRPATRSKCASEEMM